MTEKDNRATIITKEGRVRITLDEYYRTGWLMCDVCRGLKRIDNKLRGGKIYMDGDSCLKKDCMGEYKTIE